ncbi:MAG: filamentous hemagglutinin N-terminal domain-containing protein, partial [Cyanobacteria bacterium J06621_11]
MKKAAVCFYGLLGVFLAHSFTGAAEAQIIPDDTLSGESSVVIPDSINGSQNETVIGGARRGGNLFHSFEGFTIPSGQSVYFVDPEGVTRIFSRVTGNSVSEIRGTLGVLGRSDLFFINNNGILFGPDAQLQVGGSFIASTADTIQFADGFEFSSVSGSTPSLLTSTVPTGLGLQDAASITVQNAGREVVDNIFTDELSPRTGLSVLPNQTIALIGGSVNFDGGILRTPGGAVEIGSVANGKVSLSTSPDGLGFDYEDVTAFGELRFSRLSFIETSGAPAGRVHLTGRDVSLRDGSLVLARNIGEDVPGNIEVDASESFEIGLSDLSDELLSGFYSDNFGAIGSDVVINAPKISVLNGGQIFTNNYNSGSSGDIFINARDYVQVDGFNASSERLVSFITSNGLDSADS